MFLASAGGGCSERRVSRAERSGASECLHDNSPDKRDPSSAVVFIVSASPFPTLFPPGIAPISSRIFLFPPTIYPRYARRKPRRGFPALAVFVIPARYLSPWFIISSALKIAEEHVEIRRDSIYSFFFYFFNKIYTGRQIWRHKSRDLYFCFPNTKFVN